MKNQIMSLSLRNVIPVGRKQRKADSIYRQVNKPRTSKPLLQSSQVSVKRTQRSLHGRVCVFREHVTSATKKALTPGQQSETVFIFIFMFIFICKYIF